MEGKTIIITGGGTGGHVFPALAIAEELKDRGYPVLYVGSSRGLEARLAPQKGVPFFPVNAGQVKNKGLVKLLFGLIQTAFASLWALWFIYKKKPSAVVGVGGYVSVPIATAAFFWRVPIYLQEQNVSAGIANRFLGKLATKIYLGFEQAKKFFPAKKCLHTGNPIRKEFFRSPFPEISTQKIQLLVMGGSQGARAINNAMVSFLPRLSEQFPELSIVHQTGKPDFERVKEAYEQAFKGRYEVSPFIEDVVKAYRDSSLVICRSGALTVSELLVANRPSLLVPYPRVGQNDQTANAGMLKDFGVAKVVEQGEKFEERLWNELLLCLKPELLASMNEAFSGLPQANALATIGDHIDSELVSLSA